MTPPSDQPPPDPVPASPPVAAPPPPPLAASAPHAAAHRARAPRRGAKAVHVAWPLATIGALSLAAGNPMTPPPATGVVSSVSPASYVAPDGRTFAQLVAAHVLPDPTQTPGVLNPNVTQATIQSTICVHGWTAKVRPPTSYTDPIKQKDLPPGAKSADYELDHLDSIEDGGDPSNPQNLWTQAYNDPYGARVKDVLETHVAHMVCNGQLTLDQARAALAPNWLLGFEKYVGPLPGGSPADNDN
jgi:hypothetical protein